ncbi:hypothetical protein ACTXT7_005926 [Hymenolepis weldensis]
MSSLRGRTHRIEESNSTGNLGMAGNAPTDLVILLIEQSHREKRTTKTDKEERVSDATPISLFATAR